MAELCGTESCIATASGLTAIAATLSAHATPGEPHAHPGRRLRAGPHLRRARAGATRCDVAFFETVEELEALVDERTSLIFIEVPTSLHDAHHRHREVVAGRATPCGAPVACDSTWGTPRFFDAHALGIDISIHAGTKYIGGHSDVMLGLTTGTYEALASTRRLVCALRLHRGARRVLAGPARTAHPERPPGAPPGQRPRGRGLARSDSRGRARALPGPPVRPRPRAVAAASSAALRACFSIELRGCDEAAYAALHRVARALRPGRQLGWLREPGASRRSRRPAGAWSRSPTKVGWYDCISAWRTPTTSSPTWPTPWSGYEPARSRVRPLRSVGHRDQRRGPAPTALRAAPDADREALAQRQDPAQDRPPRGTPGHGPVRLRGQPLRGRHGRAASGSNGEVASTDDPLPRCPVRAPAR